MSFLGDIAKIASVVAPVVIPGVGGYVASAAAGTVAAGEAKKDFKKKQQAQAKETDMSEIFGRTTTFRDPYAGTGVLTPNVGTQTSGGGFFSDVGQFFRSAGGVVREAFGSGIPQLLGVGRPQGVAQQPAVTSVTNVGAQESQGSGSIQAGFGSTLAPLISAGRNLISSPAGQIAIGTGVGLATGLMDASGRSIRITRKTKRLAQQAYALSMGDLSRATQLFAQLSGISVNEQQYVLILTKRFRNDGAVITKAALRKTRSTIRKMKSMCDMYDDLRPAARRRSPMKRARATTTLIKN
tara:strand:+ start:1190 stop:2080 length:891 start_codon:yes stop_codon:yes gene_type:complete